MNEVIAVISQKNARNQNKGWAGLGSETCLGRGSEIGSGENGQGHQIGGCL